MSNDKAKDLDLLNRKRKELKDMTDKYGASLATKPHPRFAGRSLRDSVEYAITKGSITVVRETIAAVKRVEGSLEVSAQTDGYVVAYGKTFDLNDKFRQYGFTLKKLDGIWVWYREILSDKLWYWTQTVEGFGPGVQAFYVKDLSKVGEAVQTLKEVAPVEKRPELESHELDGAVFEVKKWYAQQFKENNNTQYAFRNLKILKVKQESAKAYLVDAEFFSGIASSCGCCGLELNNDISRATGIGPICAKKIGLPRPTMATAKEIVKQLESLSTAQGVFKDVWIPKSQIKVIKV